MLAAKRLTSASCNAKNDRLRARYPRESRAPSATSTRSDAGRLRDNSLPDESSGERVNAGSTTATHMTSAVARATMLASTARYRSRIGDRSAIIANKPNATSVRSGARITLARSEKLSVPDTELHIVIAYAAAVIAHDPAIAIHATRSPFCRHLAPRNAASAAITGGTTIHRSPEI